MPPVKKQIPLRVGLEDEAQFDNFFPGNKSNSDLLDYLRSDESDLLYLYGLASTGVSHLLIALVKQAESIGKQAQYVPLKELLEAPAEMLNKLDSLDLICFDDIELVSQSGQWQLEIFHLFNRFVEHGSRIVFGAHCAPANLEIELADLRSRILSGQTWAITELADAEKLMALKRRAQLRGFNLSDQVASYLLGHRQRDMSNLMKHLDQLDRLSLEEKKLVTVPLVKRLLND